jgi:hypothetical protein
MIGKKRLADVRAGLLEECTKSGIAPARWFDEQIGRLERSPSPNPLEIETLKLIRDGLRVKPARSKHVRRRARARSSK